VNTIYIRVATVTWRALLLAFTLSKAAERINPHWKVQLGKSVVMTEYEQKIGSAVWKAIIEASMGDVVDKDTGKPIAAINSGECLTALIKTIAMLIYTSEATATPTKLREACDQIAKRIRSCTAAAQKHAAQGGAQPFDTVREGQLQ
jgi:hypothetical protein